MDHTQKLTFHRNCNEKKNNPKVKELKIPTGGWWLLWVCQEVAEGYKSLGMENVYVGG